MAEEKKNPQQQSTEKVKINDNLSIDKDLFDEYLITILQLKQKKQMSKELLQTEFTI